MPNPPSSVKATRESLFTQLQSQVTGPNVLVCLGEPGPYQPDDIIAVGNVHRTTNPSHLVGSGGTGWLDETFQIQVLVEIYRGGDDEPGAFGRLCDVVDQVEAAVRADPSIGGLVLFAYPQQVSYESGWEADHKGRLATAVLSITFMAIQ